jgi:hypothetical protein
MTNPRTIDRRDVEPSTNPVGDFEKIEEAKTNLAEPLDKNAAKLPAGGNESSITGVPGSVKPDEMRSDVYGGLPRGVPPARSGQSQTDVEPAEPDKDNPGRMDQKRAAGRDTVHVQNPRSTGQ